MSSSSPILVHLFFSSSLLETARMMSGLHTQIHRLIANVSECKMVWHWIFNYSLSCKATDRQSFWEVCQRNHQKNLLGKSIYQKQKTIKSHFINKLQDPNTSKHTSNFKKKIHVLRTPWILFLYVNPHSQIRNQKSHFYTKTTNLIVWRKSIL